ncbi:MAG: hypothetical protein ACMG57_04415 [Candidatus Dojkabacteria bacterium]
MADISTLNTIQDFKQETEEKGLGAALKDKGSEMLKKEAVAKAKQVALKVVLGNPWVLAAIIIIVVALIIFVVVYTKVNDSTGGVVKTLCVRLEDCVKLMVEKGGGALQNAN